MLPEINRLNNSDDILRVIKSGRSLSSGSFLLRFKINNSKLIRIGFIISGKEIKKAYKRNLIKRRAREIIRKKLSVLKNGYDLLFIFNRKAEDISFSALEDDISQSLIKAKLL